MHVFPLRIPARGGLLRRDGRDEGYRPAGTALGLGAAVRRLQAGKANRRMSPKAIQRMRQQQT
jgi:hypothetical protein